METLATLFIAVPLTLIPLLDRNSRMDMVDLYDAGQTALVENRYGGESELTALSDSVLTVRLTEVSTLQMRMLSDTLLSIEHTVTTADSIGHTSKKYYNRNFLEINCN